jgi:plasmid stabilization system protein ParE
MKLEWSPFAVDDRDQIFSHIEQDSRRAAAIIDERITRTGPAPS